jgi:carboxyl-terminal processing protease
MVAIGLTAGSVTAEPPDRAATFDRIHQIVTDEFFDPGLQGVDWPAARARFRPLAASAPTRESFAAVVNEMLALLHTSHTQYLTPDTPRYFELLSVFESSDAYADDLARVRENVPQHEIGYVGIGIDTMVTEEGTFLLSVYDGLPADQAGLQVGDRLVGVDGQEFHPIRSFQARDGQDVIVAIQRERAGPTAEVLVKPRFLAGASLFREAMRQSVRVVPAGPHQIGYVHIWSYAGEQYQELLREILFDGPLSKVDALVLDLRDGWGGASPDYLNLFHRDIPRLLTKPRAGEPMVLDTQWRRPTALVINERVRSGKEVFTWGFRQMARGPVVGHTTAGAVTAGSLKFLPDHSVLYLAVADCEVDGERLEGRGVSPTIAVERPIPYCQGRDPQREAAIQALTASLQEVAR